MSVCVTTNYLYQPSVYPVADPRRTAGPGPYMYSYGFAWDGVKVTVTRDSALSSCQMTVSFSSNLSEDKEIQAWNIFANNFVDRIGSARLGLGSSMQITRSWGPGRPCGSGTDTVILCRYFAWPRGRTALYTFQPQDFWDFWGGCTVMFEWISDTMGSNRWGDQTPEPIYPMVQLPDRTLLKRITSRVELFVVFGGTDFAADSTYLTAMGFDANTARARPARLPSIPADGTLLRELNRPEVFVVYGGAKFWIPDPQTLFDLGFDFSQVSMVPPGGTSKLLTMPIDGTLIKTQHDPKVYLIDNQQLRWVTSPQVMDRMCLAWRHVRTVPDNTLAALPRGLDLL